MKDNSPQKPQYSLDWLWEMLGEPYMPYLNLDALMSDKEEEKADAESSIPPSSKKH